MNDNSFIAMVSQTIIKLSGQSKTEITTTSIQPMGTLFEQSCALFYDAKI